MARPPAVICNFLNAYVAESRLLAKCPCIVRRALTVRRMGMDLTIAVCFCGAAKTTSLGIPLVSAMWSQADNLTRAYIQVPVLLYTIEQVRIPRNLPIGNKGVNSHFELYKRS
jgi:solute carrier family 10 (sodium/bile acid cotransporter), member 7